jgi:serine protease Do
MSGPERPVHALLFGWTADGTVRLKGFRIIMNQSLKTRLFRGGLAVVTAGLLIGVGAALRGAAMGNPAAPPPAPAASVSTTTPAASRTAALGRVDSYADVVAAVSPSVVTVRVEAKEQMSSNDFQGNNFFQQFFGSPFGNGNGGPQMQPREFTQRALGSGVIVDPNGYILTNYHVVKGADSVKVDLNDGRTLDAKVVGTDPPTDLALIKIQATGLHALPLGNSDDVRVGDVALAFGNPLGIGQTVTMGIISAKGRSTGDVGDGSYENFLQTDAPINHGNSGGALVNTKGQLIGINSQIVSNSDGNIGIGFAIPSNMAEHVVDDLRETGHVSRGQLGVTVQRVTSDLAQSLGLKNVSGAIVSQVTPGSAADHAGMKQGDVIEDFDGKPVSDTNALRNRVAEAGPGANSTVTILRNGHEQTLHVKLDSASSGASLSAQNGSSSGRTALGISVQPLTPELAAQAHAPRGLQGVLVRDVDPNGRAADAGVQQGDIIVQVNQQPVQTVEELRAALQKNPNRPVLLLINRDGQNLYLTVHD